VTSLNDCPGVECSSPGNALSPSWPLSLITPWRSPTLSEIVLAIRGRPYHIQNSERMAKLALGLTAPQMS